jgi:hypothetical protein
MPLDGNGDNRLPLPGEEAIGGLAASLRGTLIQPGDVDYDARRSSSAARGQQT